MLLASSPSATTAADIHFGTDGWRAVISDQFTFANVRHVAQAIAQWVLEQTPPNGEHSVVVGFDTRFLSDRYAIEVTRVLAGNGIHVYLTSGNCPTPALSWAVPSLKATAGVMITASHNPPRYNGIKVKASHGGSAMPADTAQIERFLQENLAQGRAPAYTTYDAPGHDRGDSPDHPRISRYNTLPGYLAHLKTLVDFDAIAVLNPRVVADPMYGAGRGYLRAMIAAMGVEVHEIRHELNPGFGGVHPEPIPRNLRALVHTVLEGEFDAGLATDGDADRVGAVDDTGRFVSPHMIFALVLRHLAERGQRGDVVKTVSTTLLVDRLARHYGLTLHETPVGFNHIADHILKGNVLIGGEESGSLTIQGHVPEGDGLLMGLLLLEVMAKQGQRKLSRVIDDLLAEQGPVFYDRHDLRVPPFSKQEMVARLTDNAPATLGDVGVARVNSMDGVKYLLEDDAWLLIRPSGTEPVLRIYAEGRSPEQVQALLAAGQSLAGV
ncbi:MAG: phosphoglucomutase/phosphomannomutase family protein [Anaerolineae bacterium]